MGYNHASAFLPAPPRPKFFPPWEGPVVGFPNVTKQKEIIDAVPESEKFKPKIEIKINPINIGKTAAMLLDLRARWLDVFLVYLKAINPAIPRDVAVMWVNNYMPKTADELATSMNVCECEKLAIRLADAWEAE